MCSDALQLPQFQLKYYPRRQLGVSGFRAFRASLAEAEPPSKLINQYFVPALTVLASLYSACLLLDVAAAAAAISRRISLWEYNLQP